MRDSLRPNHSDILIICLKEFVRALNNEPEKALIELKEIGKTLDNIVPYRDGHNQRVAKYALMIAQEMDFSKEQLLIVGASALLHDVGKIGIDEMILYKTEPLTEKEKEEIERHVLNGYQILSEFTEIPEILNGVKYHHEFWDGSGYPLGLKNGEIPLVSRILAVCDAYDAMTSKRPYRKAFTRDEAIDELKRLSGIQFDKNVVKIFLKSLKGL
uniref:HD-GYP domain-containing protein n=1 Tax=candidate division WOR-3 bacterium TaxID=2052148 RepID=A0A7C4XV47_UNCW3